MPKNTGGGERGTEPCVVPTPIFTHLWWSFVSKEIRASKDTSRHRTGRVRKYTLLRWRPQHGPCKDRPPVRETIRGRQAMTRRSARLIVGSGSRGRQVKRGRCSVMLLTLPTPRSTGGGGGRGGLGDKNRKVPPRPSLLPATCTLPQYIRLPSSSLCLRVF